MEINPKLSPNPLELGRARGSQYYDIWSARIDAQVVATVLTPPTRGGGAPPQPGPNLPAPTSPPSEGLPAPPLPEGGLPLPPPPTGGVPGPFPPTGGAPTRPAGSVSIDRSDFPPGHYYDLAWDPDRKDIRLNEADTALRLEGKFSIRLERSNAGGDWIDPATGKIYDGCSPPDGFSRTRKGELFFDLQIDGGNYERSLRRHLDDPKRDYVVIDLTDLNLTTDQLRRFNALLDNVRSDIPDVFDQKVVRLP